MTATPAVDDHKSRITLESRPEGTVITVSGVLDWKSVAELLTDTGKAEGAPRLLVDLTSAERIDSAGTGGLITAILRERRAHAEIAIVAGGMIAEVLDAAGVTQVAPRFDTRRSGEQWLTNGKETA